MLCYWQRNANAQYPFNEKLFSRKFFKHVVKFPSLHRMNIEFFPFNFWFDKQARYYVSNKLNSPVNDRSWIFTFGRIKGLKIKQYSAKAEYRSRSRMLNISKIGLNFLIKPCENLNDQLNHFFNPHGPHCNENFYETWSCFQVGRSFEGLKIVIIYIFKWFYVLFASKEDIFLRKTQRLNI